MADVGQTPGRTYVRGLWPAGAAAGRVALPVADRARVFIDLTHLGRHVTGIERVSIEQFQNVDFADADVTHVRADGLASLIWCQQVWLPLLALLNPGATFVFPGFPPSPLFALLWRNRAIMYVHDLFLITRRCDLGGKARWYMARPFAFAVRRLKRFQVNSEKTGADLAPYLRADATVALYRPAVRNVFALDSHRSEPVQPSARLRFASLGTVEPRKNYSALIPLLDALAQVGVDAEVHIIGREGWGDVRDALRNDPRVIIHGYLPSAEVKAVLEACDLYLCTSHDEGLGLPLLEAQYAGLPVIAPDMPVFREVLAASGTFIDPARPDQAAARIVGLLSCTDWRRSSAEAARTNLSRWNGLASSDAALVRTMFATREAAPAIA